MASSSTPFESVPDWDSEDWELRHEDDGFIYKILKRPRLLSDPPPESPSAASRNLKEEERRMRKRKYNTLCKLKAQYQTEIGHWEVLSNNLRSMELKAAQYQEESSHKQLQKTPQTSSPQDHIELASGSLIDELILQAEAQEAIINDVANLCDVVDSMCNAHQEEVVESFMDLPVWASPRELMASLCSDD